MAETKGFIKNYDLLKEDSKVEDLLDFTESTSSFAKKIDSINQPSIVGLIGKFGSGKSTMLYQVKQGFSNVCWVDFDAWKYPERKDLWEGFIIDFAEQLGMKEKTVKSIEGKTNIDSSFDVIDNITDIFDDTSTLKPLIKLIKKTLNISPAKRVFELQYILTSLINKVNHNFIIVVEDIDRSGDAGIYFLETLKQFLRELKTTKKIVVVVPIGNDKYSKNLDSYLKALDYIEFFEPKFNGLTKFVDNLFFEEEFKGELLEGNRTIWSGENRRKQIISFLDNIFKLEETLTIRLIKTILRNANNNFKNQRLNGYNPDLRMTICFEFTKHIKYDIKSKESFYTYIKTQRQIPKDTIIGAFILAMVQNSDSITTGEISEKILFSHLPIYIKDISKENILDKMNSSWFIQELYKEKNPRLHCCSYYLDY